MGVPLVETREANILLIFVGTLSLVATICHCMIACCCSHRAGNRSQPEQSRAEESRVVEILRSTDASASRLIPAYKYQKSVDKEDGTCSICLSEFEEGEELRTLPDCLHTFHVPCIDMWLTCHSNCPMCRADAARLSSSEVTGDPRMLQVVV